MGYKESIFFFFFLGESLSEPNLYDGKVESPQYGLAGTPR